MPQLEAIAADIESQEAEIAAQLEAMKEKKEAIRAVISMFDGSSDTTAAASVAEKAIASAKTSTAKKSASTTKSTAKSKTTAKKKTKKKDGRAADWQKYTLPGVKDQPMPEAVQMILATQPDKDFKIAEVMSGLFKDNMPKNQYLKARNRISNILSGGVRAGEWYKGERGAYRLTSG
ncbi:MAG: hypothetical protein ACFB16_18020 [Phormidesmis sp.]